MSVGGLRGGFCVSSRQKGSVKFPPSGRQDRRYTYVHEDMRRTDLSSRQCSCVRRYTYVLWDMRT